MLMQNVSWQKCMFNRIMVGYGKSSSLISLNWGDEGQRHHRLGWPAGRRGWSGCSCKVGSPLRLARALGDTALISLSGLLEISTVEQGVVSLFGVRSALFVAMNRRGRLYTTVSASGQGKLQLA